MHSETAINIPANPTTADTIPLTPVPRLLLRPAEAALALGISARLLWSLTRQGVIPCVRLGGSKAVRYAPAALQAFIDGASSAT